MEPVPALTLTSDEIRTGERLFASPCVFVKSAPGLEHLPAADRPEIAFAGRSNVGKSSLINALTRNKSLARASNTPGRTQELNYFATADGRAYLVDMPGYGYAEAPREKVEAWTELVRDYLRWRPSLARVFLLIDARHGLKPPDREIMQLLDAAAVSFQIVLTKADKVGAPALEAVIAATASAIQANPAAFPVVLATSAEKGAGIPELRAVVAGIVAAQA